MKNRILAFCVCCLLATTFAACDSDTLQPSLVEPSGTASIKKLREQPAARTGEQLRSTKFQQDTLINFMEESFLDINSYWMDVWAEAKYKPPTVNHRFPPPGVSLAGACGTSDDGTAAYCEGDDTITVSQKLASEVVKGFAKEGSDSAVVVGLTGDFAVATAIAHEYSHNLQAELGLFWNADGTRKYPVYKTELHADCWGGIWASSAYFRGLLEDGDIQEGLTLSWVVGDFLTDPEKHHGTPKQRVDAFNEGYKSGKPLSCDKWLLTDYS